MGRISASRATRSSSATTTSWSGRSATASPSAAQPAAAATRPSSSSSKITRGQLGIEALVPPDQIARHWFIKFPRRSTPGERALHAQILRAEAAYYRALVRDLGLDVIGPVALHESDRGDPSLWAPRFDRRDNAPVAVESLYSLVGSTQPGAQLNALQALRELTGLLREADLGDHAPALILEYLRRELLNLLLGNSDNHGRNLALLRGERPLRWAPIYDLAPMVMDPTGVTRATTWHDPLERGGQLRWRDICQALAPLARGINLWDELRAFAARLLPLPALLEDEGFPTEALHFPRVWVNTLEKDLAGLGFTMKRLSPDERHAFFEALYPRVERGDLTLPELLRTLRVDLLGADQDTFARIGKVSVRTLRELEAGRGNPSLKTLQHLLRPFGLQMAPRPTRPYAEG
jgi:DNA-binding XRE family transcriptional regulator